MEKVYQFACSGEPGDGSKSLRHYLPVNTPWSGKPPMQTSSLLVKKTIVTVFRLDCGAERSLFASAKLTVGEDSTTPGHFFPTRTG
ncbi:hypothetical protein KKB83_02800 [Patescibacteria group bacterium]|nr:hypothetical protein [Patescibacteria group bacterium]